MSYIKTSDYMKPDTPWTDPETGEVTQDFYYSGPGTWAEQGEDGKVLYCAIRWDDMWLESWEIKRMIDDIMDIPEVAVTGAIWQQMRVAWRDDIEHFVMEVPAYPRKE